MADDDNILSALFSNGGWRSILGLDAPTNTPPPPMPPGGGGPWGGTPPQPTNTQGYQGGMIPIPANQPPPSGAPGPMSPPPPPSLAATPEDAMSLSANPSGATMPAGGTPGAANASPSPAPPGMGYNGPGYAGLPPPNGGTPVPTGGTGGMGAFGGPPKQIATNTGPVTVPGGGGALPPPPPNGGGNPGETAGGLMNAFGLTGKPNWGNALETGLAGLGKGLSQVGAMRPGTPGAQAFAAGAGGGLQGGIQNIQQRRLLDRLKQNDYFTHASNAYRDYLAGVNTDNQSLVASARARHLDLQYGPGGGGRNPLANTEYGKAIQLDHDVSTETNQFRQQLDTLQRTLKSYQEGGFKPKEVEEIRQKIRDTQKQMEDVQGRREAMAKRRGIDPNAIRTGDSKENAFDYDKLTPQQRLAVPEGKMWKRKDPQTGEEVFGRRKPYSEVPPYPGWQPPQQPGQQQAPQQTSAADQDAMYGAQPQAPQPQAPPPQTLSTDLGDDEAA
jgi:hypothetical protein